MKNCLSFHFFVVVDRAVLKIALHKSIDILLAFLRLQTRHLAYLSYYGYLGYDDAVTHPATQRSLTLHNLVLLVQFAKIKGHILANDPELFAGLL